MNGIDWAARRAANGHVAPYKFAYVEIGNEYEPAIQKIIDQNYWILGEPVHINPACAQDKISCIYVFGGSTRFTQQLAVALADWREPSLGGGDPVWSRLDVVRARAAWPHSMQRCGVGCRRESATMRCHCF